MREAPIWFAATGNGSGSCVPGVVGGVAIALPVLGLISIIGIEAGAGKAVVRTGMADSSYD
jgi:hypothetical protein